jgi:hypothetical protein
MHQPLIGVNLRPEYNRWAIKSAKLIKWNTLIEILIATPRMAESVPAINIITIVFFTLRSSSTVLMTIR